MKYLYATQGHHKDIYDKPEKEKVRVLSLQLQYIQHPGYNSFSHISGHASEYWKGSTYWWNFFICPRENVNANSDRGRKNSGKYLTPWGNSHLRTLFFGPWRNFFWQFESLTIERSEVTIIPTYDTDVLGYWVAENEELLTELKIDLAPSASRCTINLQVTIAKIKKRQRQRQRQQQR